MPPFRSREKPDAPGVAEAHGLGCRRGLFAATAAAAQSDEDAALASEPVAVEFVQQAGGATFADGRLTLTSPAAMTILFADRPRRLTGHMPNADFASYWSDAADGFRTDPPNAAVIVAGSDEPPAIVELKSLAIGTSGELVYDVEVLEGELPAEAGEVALFIDPAIYVGPRVRYYGPAPRRRVVAVGPHRRVVVAPRCHHSPYYYHDVCRVY